MLSSVMMICNFSFVQQPAGIAKTSSSAYKGSVYNSGLSSTVPSELPQAAQENA